MVNTAITKQQIHDELLAISNSARVIGAEGLVEDIKGIISRLEKDLKGNDAA